MTLDVTDAVAVLVNEADGEPESDDVIEELPDGVGGGVIVSENDTLAVGERVALVVIDAVPEGVRDKVPVAVRVTDCVKV